METPRRPQERRPPFVDEQGNSGPCSFFCWPTRHNGDVSYDVATGITDRTGADRFMASQPAGCINPFNCRLADNATVKPGSP